MKSLELYVHIPFCVRKCNYCDFLSAPGTREVQEQYFYTLFHEIEVEAEKYREYQVVSLFIGGGTPSFVDSSYIEALMTKLKESFLFSENAECSIEVNPGSADAEKLCTYKQAGLNRLSLGLQSAKNEELKILGRVHTYEEFEETFHKARKAGFFNINVDVMSALPSQTLDSYEYTLRKVCELVPEHISAYSLILEEGTPFFREYAQKPECLPDEDCERQMYERTKELLEEYGYHRYEISNYAKEGMECRHNIGYWERENYLGLGLGSSSLVENIRFQNETNLEKYKENEGLPIGREETTLSLNEQMEEFMFLGLRLVKGVEKKEFFRQFGVEIDKVYDKVLKRNQQDGLLQVGERVALTEKGLDLSNYVMAQFLFSSGE